MLKALRGRARVCRLAVAWRLACAWGLVSLLLINGEISISSKRRAIVEENRSRRALFSLFFN